MFLLFPVSRTARMTFVRSLATLVRAGVPLRRALEIVTAGCRDSRLREALQSVASDIDSGVALSAAFEKRPSEFSVLFIAMIRAGELAGAVDDVLDRVATFMEYENAARKRLQSALAYPAVVTLAAIGLVLFLVSNTVPAFSQLFAQMHVDLPFTTRVLLAVGAALQSPLSYLALPAAAAGIAFGWSGARRSSVALAVIDRAVLMVPVFGAIVRMSLLARFARTLGTLLRSGVPLLSALHASREVVTNASYALRITKIADDLAQGATISDAFGAAHMYDNLVLALVRVGEETGALDDMLIRVAEYYEVDVETTISSLAGILEPIIIVVLGAIVGTIVGSILIPLYSMIGSIK
jgi:type IV pilus assembly protein PilC